MKIPIITLVVITSLLVLLMALSSLFNQPVNVPVITADEPPIEIIDKANLVIGDSAACDATRSEIHELITAPQACRTDTDCDTGVHLCGVVLNQTNHSRYHELNDEEAEHCTNTRTVQCAGHPLKKNLCVLHKCVRISDIDTSKIIREYIQQNKKAASHGSGL